MIAICRAEETENGASDKVARGEKVSWCLLSLGRQHSFFSISLIRPFSSFLLFFFYSCSDATKWISIRPSGSVRSLQNRFCVAFLSSIHFDAQHFYFLSGFSWCAQFVSCFVGDCVFGKKMNAHLSLFLYVQLPFFCLFSFFPDSASCGVWQDKRPTAVVFGFLPSQCGTYRARKKNTTIEKVNRTVQAVLSSMFHFGWSWVPKNHIAVSR